MEWKFKENAEPQGSSEGFWYDLTSGGYINPAEVLADKKQIIKLNKAIKIIESFEVALTDKDLIEKF